MEIDLEKTSTIPLVVKESLFDKDYINSRKAILKFALDELEKLEKTKIRSNKC